MAFKGGELLYYHNLCYRRIPPYKGGASDNALGGGCYSTIDDQAMSAESNAGRLDRGESDDPPVCRRGRLSSYRFPSGLDG